MTKNPLIKTLFYMSHKENIFSMLKHGILSHHAIDQKKIDPKLIYDNQIVTNRKNRITPNGASLWEYANFYFQARNPMLYRVIREHDLKDLVILGINPDILNHKNTLVSIGNAASPTSEILPVDEGLIQIQQMWDILNNDWWNEQDGSKRKIMAECLVPNFVEPKMIHSIFVSTQKMKTEIETLLEKKGLTIIPEIVVDPKMFFQPIRRFVLGRERNLSLVEGDMFFSKLHTLTISVNTVGVMGKGLASRARYQFPDLYVYYQDKCKQKELKMGFPIIYKREGSLDNELAFDSTSLINPNATKWFLLFPTKKHWKEKSDLAGIETGLKWLVDHAKNEGIQSLALPALGCGLGQLSWSQVGPLMCHYLEQLPFTVAIYLPHEDVVPDEQLTESFLLG